ncbi:MAG: hypothetical protein JO126_04030 [Alphaproteobacteria bacterium]|nr:hypothetical protein [Alphaproteobacteria bacterium]MBV8548607.1 hypothetical protein [Alphaproteobacteria bacterium]
MKNILKICALSGFMAMVSFAAHADSFMDDLKAAVASGNMEKVDVLAAKNPKQQGEIAAYLLQQASADSSSDADKAAKLFKEAKSYVAQMDKEQAQQAVTEITSMLTLASSSTFETAHPDAAGDILAAAVFMTNQPSIATLAPGLNATALGDAKAYADNAPAGVKAELDDAVSLAQSQGSAPNAHHNNQHIPTGH